MSDVMSENTQRDINIRTERFLQNTVKERKTVGCYSVMKVHSSAHEVLWENELVSTKTIHL